MSGPKFAIPEEYRGLLKYVEPADKRSDGEVLASLEHHVPVTSEKNVWGFWATGLSTAPAWNQRNVASWVRMNNADGWTVRILNAVEGSPNHWSKFVPDNIVPKALVQGKMDGTYAPHHSADVIRGAVLYLYGGVYLDVSCQLFRTFDRICWNQMLTGDYGMANTPIVGDVIQNSFFASRKGNVFVKHWHDMFVHLWSTPEDRTNGVGLLDNPILKFTEEVDFPVPPVGLNVSLKTFQEYVTQILCWQRMCRLSAPEKDGVDFNKYWREHILPISMMSECWGIEEVCGWSAERAFGRMTAKIGPAQPDDADYQESVKLAWRLLSQSSMQKFFHGKKLLKVPAIGSWLSAPENLGKDCEPGTFAELLRYGAEHFVQTREEVVLAPLPEIKPILHKGFLEA